MVEGFELDRAWLTISRSETAAGERVIPLNDEAMTAVVELWD